MHRKPQVSVTVQKLMVQNICKIHQKPLILGTSKTVYTHGRQAQGEKASRGQGPQQRKMSGKG